METMGIYANTIAFHIDEQNGDKSEPEDLKPEHWPRRTDTTRRNLSPKIIFALLGICILVSILSLVLALILVGEMGKMKRSDADLLMDFSQWKNNVAGNVEKATSSLSDLQAEIALLRQLAGNVEKATSSLSDLQAEIALLRQHVYSCPEEWTKFKLSCYNFSSSSDNWEEAQRLCASADVQLAVINNAEEQSFLNKHVDVSWWIGLSDSASEGDWRWVDGTDYYSSVKFWADDQPNGNKDYDEDCAVVHKDGLWHDWPCSSEHTIICEKPAQ